MKLPQMSDRSMMRPVVRTGFGGLNNNLSAQDGEIVWMENLSAREFPLLTQRARRGLERTVSEPGGVGAGDKPWWVSGTGFYYDGVHKGTVEKGEKSFAAMGSRIMIFPDKKYYDASADTFGDMGVGRSLSGVSFQNGVFGGVPANANTLYKSGAAWPFSPGDAVAVSGCETHPENNKTAIVREVEGDYLRFYENTFTLDSTIRYTALVEGLQAGAYHFDVGQDAPDWRQFTLSSGLSEGDTLTWNGTGLDAVIGGVGSTIPVTEGSAGEALVFADIPTDYTEAGEITVIRPVPDLDHVCVNENRLWGCKGDTIYASALGDPFNFYVFDGLSTDSWQSGTVDSGDFTACVSYLGYPVFFKEDAVYKVYGEKPSNFQWTPSARLGVKAGCAGSLAVAGETLYYLSRAGIVAYTGGIPAVISGELGANTGWEDAKAGSDALRYYVSMSDGTAYSLFVYDTRWRTWHREDAVQAAGFAFWDGGLHMLAADGKLWRLDGGAGTKEGPLSWTAEFADSVRFYETTDSGSQNKKGPLRILIRATLGESSTITVKIKYDDGSTQIVGTLEGNDGRKKTYILPLILRRCDHYRLSMDGVGDAVVYSLTVEQYNGSQFQGSRAELPNG